MTKYIFFMIFCTFSSSIFASYVISEISRDHNASSDDALGVIWSKRKTAKLVFQSIAEEKKTNTTITSKPVNTLIGPEIFYFRDQFSIETRYLNFSFKENANGSPSGDVDGLFFDLKLGYRISNKVGMAATYEVRTAEYGNTELIFTTPNLGLSYKLNDTLILGIGYQFGNFEVANNSSALDLSFGKYKLGVGYQKYKNDNEALSLETFVTYQKKKSNSLNGLSVSIGEEAFVSLKGIYILREWQIKTFFNLTNTEEFDGSNDTSKKELRGEVEYLFPNSFYLTPSISFTTVETKVSATSTTDNDSTVIGLKLGYRKKDWEVFTGIELADEDINKKTSTITTSIESTSGSNIVLNVSYFY